MLMTISLLPATSLITLLLERECSERARGEIRYLRDTRSMEHYRT
jgi:hypothetical protein